MIYTTMWTMWTTFRYYFYSLQKGDIVEVYYNDKYELYMIKSEGETLHFVHPDSVDSLDTPGSVCFYKVL